jgi:hypothetical protein
MPWRLLVNEETGRRGKRNIGQSLPGTGAQTVGIFNAILRAGRTPEGDTRVRLNIDDS